MTDTGYGAEERDEYAGHLADLIEGIETAFDGIDSAIRSLEQMDELCHGHPHARDRNTIRRAIRLLLNVKEHAQQQQEPAGNAADIHTDQQQRATHGTS